MTSEAADGKADQALAQRYGYAPGAQVLVRDEVWLVDNVTMTRHDGAMLEVTGVSEFVRDTKAVFYTALDVIQTLDPHKTKLVPDDSANHRRARLYLEAVVRKSFLPQTEHGLALVDNFLMDKQLHQLRPAELALSMKNPQPRLLIADVVGLGKTLEIGVLLAELIRRGRGERILVVTPQQVLEQFQRELWTRFAIPLARLDSAGVQRVQQEIPAGRNPFAYFKRVIISVDTLKNGNLYRHHLDGTNWDAVVIDESHNLINPGSQRGELAHTLAPHTDALILASATPHNGDAKSFARLINLLDPAAIVDPEKYDVADLKHLYIRRTKAATEVRDSLKDAWADRGPSLPVHAAATEKEEAVFTEFAERWMPRDNSPSASERQLFAYSLFKGFLSSHKALIESIDKRTNSAAAKTPGELAALADLRAAAVKIADADSAKRIALIEELRSLGVGPNSTTRVVVFSERIATLNWLAETVPVELGFDERVISPDDKKPWLAYGGAVQVMHRDVMNDQEQMELVEKFGLSRDPVRLLFTGDIASEGVNLHQQCHLLVHYDLPWSLIRIEQRNGRIDRYGQAHTPEFRAMILTSEVKWRLDKEGNPRPLDDRLVGQKLLLREEQAHRIEGSAEAVTGLYRAKDEEDRLIKDLIAGKSVEESVTDSRQAGAGFLASFLGQAGDVTEHQDVAEAVVPTVFQAGTAEYFDAALREVFTGDAEDALELRREDDGTISFVPPSDLTYRFKALPSTYLKERNLLGKGDKQGRLLVTFSRQLAQKRLDAARDSTDSLWPNVSYLTDIHPVLDWITDKVLVQVGQHEALVLGADVAEPVFLLQGIYSNKLGRPTVVEWMAVTGLTRPGEPKVTEMTAALKAANVSSTMPGRATPHNLAALQDLVPSAVDAAARYLESRKADYDAEVEIPLAGYRSRIRHWHQEALDFADSPKLRPAIHATAANRTNLVDSLTTIGAPMLRLLAVLEGNS